MKVVSAPKNLCTDNAAMIAWMAWELKNAEQDVDIKHLKTNDTKRNIYYFVEL